MYPSNEAETIQVFKLAQERLGWRFVHLQTAFPDAIIENERGQQLVVEFEYVAKNFKRHGHDHNGCDLIVCWSNDWHDAPLPVWALKDCTSEEADIIAGAIRAHTDALKAGNRELGRTIHNLREKTADAEYWQSQAEYWEEQADFEDREEPEKPLLTPNRKRYLWVGLVLLLAAVTSVSFLSFGHPITNWLLTLLYLWWGGAFVAFFFIAMET